MCVCTRGARLWVWAVKWKKTSVLVMQPTSRQLKRINHWFRTSVQTDSAPYTTCAELNWTHPANLPTWSNTISPWQSPECNLKYGRTTYSENTEANKIEPVTSWHKCTRTSSCHYPRILAGSHTSNSIDWSLPHCLHLWYRMFWVTSNMRIVNCIYLLHHCEDFWKTMYVFVFASTFYVVA